MNDGETERRTLAELLSTFELEGYTTQTAVRPGGFVYCLGCQMESDAAELQVDAIERLEGASDPDDMLAVAAVVCPVCESQGTLVLGYGPDSDPADAEVLARLGDVDG